MRTPQRWLIGFNALGLTASLTLMASIFGTLPASAQVRPAAVQEGYVLLERGWVNDAIAAFQRALQRNPQSLDARLGLAIAYQRAGQDVEAWQAYQQVLAQAPDNRQALAAVGLLGGYRAEWQAQGITALTRLLELTPADQTARSQRALLLGYQGRFVEAIADYEILLAAANPTPETVLGAAQVYTYSGDYAQGLALFEQYRSRGQSIPESAITAYALALQETGRVADAIRILESQLQTNNSLNATTIQLRSSLAVAYQRNQQPERALEVLAPLRGRSDAVLPLARALSAIARESANADLYQEAVDLYRQALAETRNPSTGFTTEVADVLSEVPISQAEALRLYDQLIEQQPADLAIQVKRLILAAELGQLSRSDLQQQLQSVLRTFPSNPIEQQRLAQALIRLNSPDPALLPIYQRLLQAEAPVPFLYFRIAQMQMQQGSWAAATESITAYQATAIGGQDLAADLLLAEIERQQGNLDASIQRYEAVIAQAQSSKILEDALLGLAGIRKSQQQLENALLLYEQLLARNPQNWRGRLGQASLAYQVQRFSIAEATAVLEAWLAAEPSITPATTPPELLDLVAVLPPDPQRQDLYERLLAIAPRHIALNRRYIQVLAMQDPASAIAYVEQLTVQNPDQVEVYFVQGELAQTLNDLDLASQAYQAILARQPQNADALAALGGVRFQQRRFAEAEALFEQVLALKPDDWETRRVLAELSLAQDHPIAALQQFEAMQESPSSSADDRLEQRIQRIQVDLLRRRGFQPYWERY